MVKRVGLTMRRSLPVFAHETTSSEPAWRRFVVRASRFCDRSARSVLLARISCSENPPKTRAWKPSNGGVLSLKNWCSEYTGLRNTLAASVILAGASTAAIGNRQRREPVKRTDRSLAKKAARRSGGPFELPTRHSTHSFDLG